MWILKIKNDLVSNFDLIFVTHSTKNNEKATTAEDSNKPRKNRKGTSIIKEHFCILY